MSLTPVCTQSWYKRWDGWERIGSICFQMQKAVPSEGEVGSAAVVHSGIDSSIFIDAT